MTKVQNFEKYCNYIDTSCNGVIQKYKDNEISWAMIEGELSDLTHEIELSKPKDVVSGYKIYKELRELLIKRREVKDENAILKELYDYINADQEFKNRMNTIKNNMEKKIDQLSKREYKPRVRNDLSITNQPTRSFDELMKHFKNTQKIRQKHKWQ